MNSHKFLDIILQKNALSLTFSIYFIHDKHTKILMKTKYFLFQMLLLNKYTNISTNTREVESSNFYYFNATNFNGKM